MESGTNFMKAFQIKYNAWNEPACDMCKQLIFFLFQCVLGFTGTSCETNIDNCDPDPCVNAGVCSDGVNSFSCTCIHPDWYGNICQHGEFRKIIFLKQANNFH